MISFRLILDQRILEICNFLRILLLFFNLFNWLLSNWAIIKVQTIFLSVSVYPSLWKGTCCSLRLNSFASDLQHLFVSRLLVGRKWLIGTNGIIGSDKRSYFINRYAREDLLRVSRLRVCIYDDFVNFSNARY